jgi:signal transduction histidine kinase
MKILKSLRWKLTLWFVLLLTAIFLVLGIFVYVSRRQALYEKFDADLHLTALSISSLLALGEDSPVEQLEAQLRLIDPTISYFIYDPAGKIILKRLPSPASSPSPSPAPVSAPASSPASAAALSSQLNPSKDDQSAPPAPQAGEKSSDPLELRLSELFRAYRATQSAGPASYTIKLKPSAQSHTDRARTGLNPDRHPESGQLYRVLFYYLPLPPEDEVPAVPRFVPVEGVYLALVKSSYPIDEDLEALGRLLIISGLFLLALSTAGGLFLSARALRPVHQITSTLKEVSGAKLDLRIKEQNFDRELIPLVEQLNAALDRLQLAFERERRFTADSSHELRTPLAAMINELEVLVRKPRSAQDYQRTIGEVLATAQEMKNILEDLLLLARMEAGQKSLDLRPVNLRQMIDEVWSRIQTEVPGEAAAKSGAAAPIKSATTTAGEVKPAPAAAPEGGLGSQMDHAATGVEQEGSPVAGKAGKPPLTPKSAASTHPAEIFQRTSDSETGDIGQSFPPGLKFYNEIDPALVIRADSNHLRRAWLNLLKNAIIYNEPDGEIRVRADRQDDKVVVTVSNTGPGIPPDKLPFIFDRFFRANHYYSEAGGAGLGLSIARTIIEFQGGTIRASSQPGLTTFEIILPL